MFNALNTRVNTEKIVNMMYDYQRQEGIKKQCITNTQYLYDTVNASCPWMHAKAIAVIAHREIYTEHGIINGEMHAELMQHVIMHVVLQINKTQLIDPSAEVFDQNMTYIVYDIPKFLKHLKTKGCTKDFLAQLLTHYLEFQLCADRINLGETIVVDDAFYNAQADYVEQKIKELQD